MKIFVPLGRILFAVIFIMAGLSHFSAGPIAMAAKAGVPLANIAVPLSGVLAIVGGLSIALGIKARWGAGLIVLFLIPVTLAMHNFWAVKDQHMAMIQQIMFMKNVSMLGGALMITYFGAGPISIDALFGKKG